LQQKERAGAKYRTLERYRDLLRRINPAIGHLRLNDIRPQHLNALYADLAKPGVCASADRCLAMPSLNEHRIKKKLSYDVIAKCAGIGSSTVAAACKGKTITLANAEAIARVFNEKVDRFFFIEHIEKTLAPKTILEYHRLIRTILAQAEKEMLVPYNAAAKAVPPKVPRKDIGCFQPTDVAEILGALEGESLKWRVIVNLLIVTGCRRGEIAGLTWDKVDLETNRLIIDTSLLYSPSRGTYIDTTKTGNSRTLFIPAETTELLREYQREQDIMKTWDRIHNTGFLFTKENGEPMNPDTITKWLSTFADRHNLPHIHPHQFRHTVASVLIGNGTDIITV